MSSDNKPAHAEHGEGTDTKPEGVPVADKGGTPGKVNGAGKSTMELVDEALRELSDPAEWFRYSAEIISGFLPSADPKQKGEAGDASAGHSGHEVIWHGVGVRGNQNRGRGAIGQDGTESLEWDPSNPDVKVLALGIIAVLVIIWAFFLK